MRQEEFQTLVLHVTLPFGPEFCSMSCLESKPVKQFFITWQYLEDFFYIFWSYPNEVFQWITVVVTVQPSARNLLSLVYHYLSFRLCTLFSLLLTADMTVKDQSYNLYPRLYFVKSFLCVLSDSCQTTLYLQGEEKNDRQYLYFLPITLIKQTSLIYSK